MTRKELMSALDNMNVNYRAKATKDELERLYNENTKERENKEMKREETNNVENKNDSFELLKEMKREETNNVENKNDSFELLKEILERCEITILSETDRRITTSNVMYCKRANNKVRAYLKMKASDELATERNSQYKATVLLDLTDSHIDFAIRRMYR